MSDFLLYLQIMPRACKFYGKTGLACWSPSIKEAFTKEKSAITVSFLPTLWTQEITVCSKDVHLKFEMSKDVCSCFGKYFLQKQSPRGVLLKKCS